MRHSTAQGAANERIRYKLYKFSIKISIYTNLYILIHFTQFLYRFIVYIEIIKFITQFHQILSNFFKLSYEFNHVLSIHQKFQLLAKISSKFVLKYRISTEFDIYLKPNFHLKFQIKVRNFTRKLEFSERRKFKIKLLIFL